MVTYRVEAWDHRGDKVREYVADVDEGDGAPFILQQVLHAQDVVCARVSDVATSEQWWRCDEGLNFSEVVLG
jgi:hypothetical protein